MNYYEILGVRVDASADEIQQAYRALARKVHPDLNGQDGGRAETRMKQLNEIRDTLTDPLLRSAYDAELARTAGERPAPPDRNSGPAPGHGPPAPGMTARRPTFVSLGGLARATTAARLALGLLLVAGLVMMLDEILVRPPFAGPTIRGTLRSAVDRVASAILPSPGGRHGTAPTVSSPLPSPSAKPRPTASRPASSTPKPASAQDGVVKIGSTVAEVIRVLGPPDRTEPGGRAGSVFMVYGQLRLELRHGVVVGGAGM